jgi:hypothetical protein
MTQKRKSFVGVALALTVLGAVWAEKAAPRSQRSGQGEDYQPIKVMISPVSPLLEGPSQNYRSGQQIPVAISLTNTGRDPVYTCLSGDIYQDTPRLKRNGQLVSYTKWQNYVLQTAARERTCQKEDIPEEALLMPNEPKLVDFLVVVDDRSDPTGALAWYDTLPPGHYELSVQRHFGCCDGPMAESNIVSFDITP